MQFFISLDGLQCFRLRDFWIIFCVFCNLITGFIGCIILKNIQNKSLFDCLTHGIDMIRMIRTIFPFRTEHLQCCTFWCCGKRKKRKILMPSMRNHFTHQTVIFIQQLFFGFSFQFRILFQRVRHIGKGSFQFHGRRTRLGRMGFIHDNGKSLIRCIIHFFIDNREFLQGCDNDSLSGVQCVP